MVHRLVESSIVELGHHRSSLFEARRAAKIDAVSVKD